MQSLEILCAGPEMSNYDAAVGYFARRSGNASEMVLYIQSLAGYTSDTHEPSFLNDNVVKALCRTSKHL